MNADSVRRAWNESGPFWERYSGHIGRFFAPITEALVESVRPERGDRVVDLAAGTGDTAMAVATWGARVVATDVAGTMAAAARRRLGAQVDVVQCDACALPFESGTFDAAVSRLGLMFFPDPEGALREVLRTLRPGGRAALAVWGPREANPLFDVTSGVVSRYVPSEPEPPDSPGAWRFAEAGALAHLASRAGGVHIVEDDLDFEIADDLTFDEFWNVRFEMSDTLRDKVRQLDPARLAQVVEEVRSACNPYFATGRARFPAAAHLVAFRKAEAPS